MTFDAAAGTGRYLWQPKALVPGVYFLKVRMPDQETTAKVLLTD